MKTEWGNVRPSWHLQTTAMAMHYLGERFDVHTSSRELLFPHHENENAIAAAIEGKPLANYWIHADRVLSNGLDLAALQGASFSGRETRFWLMSTHYRRPAAGSIERLEDARRRVQRLDRCVDALMRVGPGQPCPELDQLIYDIRQGVRRGMDDDLDLPSVIAAVFQAVKRINAFVAQGLMDVRGAGRLVAALKDIDAVLGIFDFSGTPVLDADVQALLEAREKARGERQWDLADRIRDELRARRITVQDQRAPRS
jgi:cysteinyl-tRNA synthetase